MLRVNNLTGFGGRSVLKDITVTDDGDFALSSGAGTATHTYTARTSTGPDTILVVTTPEGDTITGITWNSNPVSLLIQTSVPLASTGIFLIAGAQSGDIVITFDAAVADSQITILSLDNLSSATAVDTDFQTSAGASSVTLTALTAAPSGGIRIAACNHEADTFSTTWTWTGCTVASDIDMGANRHSVAYLIDDTAGGNITAGHASGAGDISLVGVTLR